MRGRHHRFRQPSGYGESRRGHLRRSAGHASFEALSAAGCVVMTGNTGTNLCDLNIMYVPVPEKEEEK